MKSIKANSCTIILLSLIFYSVELAAQHKEYYPDPCPRATAPTDTNEG